MNTTVSGAGPEGPFYEMVEITPALAKEWLQRNTHNRTLRERVVNGYAADMAAGNWIEDGQSIKFSTTGTLLDGQHRLAAIAQSGVAARMMIVSGLADAAQDTMDTGSKRTLADALRLRGETHTVILAATILRAHKWELGYRRSLKSGGEAAPTQRQLLEVLKAHPELRRSAEIAARVRKGSNLSGSVAGLCHWLFNQIDQGDCAFFFARLGDGAGLDTEDAIYALRRSLANLAEGPGRPDETYVIALVIKAWNAYRDGRPVRILQFKVGGAAPEAYPEPK